MIRKHHLAVRVGNAVSLANAFADSVSNDLLEGIYNGRVRYFNRSYRTRPGRGPCRCVSESINKVRHHAIEPSKSGVSTIFLNSNHIKTHYIWMCQFK